MHPSDFKRELRLFLSDHEISGPLIDDNSAWSTFWNKYCSAVSDCPVARDCSGQQRPSMLAVVRSGKGGYVDQLLYLDGPPDYQPFDLKFPLDGDEHKIGLP